MMIHYGEILRQIGFSILAAGRSITFLGTGPSTPIIERKGKSRRNNTSTLLTYQDDRYLIDIPPTFDASTKFKYLLVTHFHHDAFGGFPIVQDREFLFGLPQALSTDLDKKGPWTKKILGIDRENSFGNLKVIPFKVKHDIIYGYPTFGYQLIFGDGYRVTYASDMVGVPSVAEKYFKNADMIIADGAGWKSNLATHFGVFPFLDLVEKKGWKGKVYFVQIGRPVPKHEEAQKEIRGRNKKAYLAFDGMTIRF